MPEPKTKKIGRPALTDSATILTAAHEIVKNPTGHGFADLTVGAVTARCGVKYSTFYRHFASLDALKRALIDMLLASIPHQDNHLSWDRYIHQMAIDLRNLMRKYKGMARAIDDLSAPEPDWIVLHKGDVAKVLNEVGIYRDDDAEQHAEMLFAAMLMDPSKSSNRLIGLVLEGMANGA